MKRLYIIAILSLLATLIQAQEDKGKFYTKMSTGLSNTITSISGSEPSYVFNLQADGGYFLTNKLILGLSTNLTYMKVPAFNDELSISLGVFSKYYLSTGKVRPYITGGISAHKGSLHWGYKPNQYYRTNDTGILGYLGLGVSYEITKNINLETEIKYNHFDNLDNDNYSRMNGVELNIGVSFKF
ncbi:MAG: outer membrane protein [Hyphomicrobiales bacterium]